MISLFGAVGLVVAVDDIGTMRSAAEDDVGAALLVAEFGDATGRGLALDSDADHDDVVGLEEAYSIITYKYCTGERICMKR